MESKSPEDVLHEAVLMVLDQNAEIESLDDVLRYERNEYYVLRDRNADRNLFNIKVDQNGEIVFTELTTNNVHNQYYVFDRFVCKRFRLYSAEEQVQIQKLAHKILMCCKEKMNDDQLDNYQLSPKRFRDEIDQYDILDYSRMKMARFHH